MEGVQNLAVDRVACRIPIRKTKISSQATRREEEQIQRESKFKNSTS